MPASRYSMAMDQLHQRGAKTVQPVLRSKPGTARSAGRHRAIKPIIRLAGRGTRTPARTERAGRHRRASELFGAAEEEQLTGAARKRGRKRRRRRRKRQFLKCAEEGNKEKTPSGWLSPDARNWLSFIARYHLDRAKRIQGSSRSRNRADFCCRRTTPFGKR